MPNEAAKAEKIGEIQSSPEDNPQALGAPAIGNLVTLVPAGDTGPQPMTDSERFPSKYNFYAD